MEAQKQKIKRYLELINDNKLTNKEQKKLKEYKTIKEV